MGRHLVGARAPAAGRAGGRAGAGAADLGRARDPRGGTVHTRKHLFAEYRIPRYVRIKNLEIMTEIYLCMRAQFFIRDT